METNRLFAHFLRLCGKHVNKCYSIIYCLNWYINWESIHFPEWDYYYRSDGSSSRADENASWRSGIVY